MVRGGFFLQLDMPGLSVIHVTGTKGKGSTCALVESVLRRHGFRTGECRFNGGRELLEVQLKIAHLASPLDVANNTQPQHSRASCHFCPCKRLRLELEENVKKYLAEWNPSICAL